MALKGRKNKKREKTTVVKWHLEKLFSQMRMGSYAPCQPMPPCLWGPPGAHVLLDSRTITSFSALLPLTPVTPRSGQSRAGSL